MITKLNTTTRLVGLVVTGILLMLLSYPSRSVLLLVLGALVLVSAALMNKWQTRPLPPDKTREQDWQALVRNGQAVAWLVSQGYGIDDDDNGFYFISPDGQEDFSPEDFGLIPQDLAEYVAVVTTRKGGNRG